MRVRVEGEKISPIGRPYLLAYDDAVAAAYVRLAIGRRRWPVLFSLHRTFYRLQEREIIWFYFESVYLAPQTNRFGLHPGLGIEFGRSDLMRGPAAEAVRRRRGKSADVQE